MHLHNNRGGSGQRHAVASDIRERKIQCADHETAPDQVKSTNKPAKKEDEYRYSSSLFWERWPSWRRLNKPMIKNRIAYLLSFTVLQAVAITNAYFVNLKGATLDAERFSALAFEWLQNGEWQFATNTEFFIQYLGTIYSVFGADEFIATQFGLLALFISAIYFEKTLIMMRYQVPFWAIILFLLWPSSITRVTTTMREPYLVLFTVLIGYYILHYSVTKKISNIIKMMTVGVISILFHKAYAVWFVGVVVYVILFVLKSNVFWIRSRVFYMRLALVVAGIGFLAFIVTLRDDVEGLRPLTALLSFDREYIVQILDQKSARDFRTTYDHTLDFTGPIAFVRSTFPVLLYYLAAPFPWRIENVFDLLASLEGVFRLTVLVLFGFHTLMRTTAFQAFRPLFIVVLMLVFVWAAGTTNYGTASRHHITTNWAFLMAFVMLLQSQKPPPGVRMRRTVLSGDDKSFLQPR